MPRLCLVRDRLQFAADGGETVHAEVNPPRRVGAIGMINSKTTAVRIIPVPGKGVGERVEFGGLLGYAPIMPVKTGSCSDFIARGGRIPAPVQSMKN